MMMTTRSLRARHAHERASWPACARTVSLFPATALVAFAAVVAGAWLLDVQAVTALGSGTVVSGAMAACGLGLLGTAMLLPEGSPARRGCYSVALLLALTVQAQHRVTVDATAVSLLCLGLAGLLAEARRTTSAQVTAGIGLLIGFTACLGYLYGVDTLYRVGASDTMALTSAVAVVVAALTVWLTVPHGVLQWLSFGSDSGARAQRVLVPVGLLLIPGAAWLYVHGVDRRVFGVPFGTALMTSFVAMVIVGVGYRTGRTALQMDRERDTLLDELHRVNAGLEDRVRVNVHQLDQQSSKLALFEERDRIARDLHDRVIQRIFAAGLQAASLSRVARKDAVGRGVDPLVADSLDLVALELDMAIRELRNSIFELTSIGDHDNVDQVVRDIAGRAARILGFMPRVDVSGPVAGASAELVAQLASVIQEGLSNVARHARASTVEVAVSGADGHLEVRITDDGVGLPDPLPRSSGISNLSNRARHLGGTATWANGESGGTVLVWRVPRRDQPASQDAQGYRTPVTASDSDHRAAARAAS
jgi:signal transduction histidine kinase